MDKRVFTGVAIALLATAIAVPLEALADPPPWAPAHGYRAKHRYLYYPDYQVYYAPETQMWFWLDGGSWRFGASLPAGVVVAGVPGVSVMLNTERPYEQHAYVVEHYGGRRHERERHHRRHEDD